MSMHFDKETNQLITAYAAAVKSGIGEDVYQNEIGIIRVRPHGETYIADVFSNDGQRLDSADLTFEDGYEEISCLFKKDHLIDMDTAKQVYAQIQSKYNR